MRRALWAKAVAVRVEVGLPLRRQDLRNGLLDESIHHRRDTQAANLAICLRDLHAFDRLGAEGARQQLCADPWPVVLEVVRQGLDGHAIDARRALVAAYLFEGALQILAL